MKTASNASNASTTFPAFQTISDDVSVESIESISPERIKEKLSSTPRHRYDSGVCARFTRMDEKHGIKFYYKEKMRDKTYELQNLAYDNGLAPRAFDKFDLHSAELDRTVYGYVTEAIASTFCDRYGDWETDDDNNLLFDDDCEFPEIAEEFYALLASLNEVMYVRDIHYNNVGFMPDGKMVAIDFSHCFTLDTPEDVREEDPIT
jgi:hypothetical protein